MRTQAALILAGGLVVATLVAGIDAMNIANSRSTLTVTGSAKRTCAPTSRCGAARSTRNRPASRTRTASSRARRSRVRAYLVGRGFADTALVLSQVRPRRCSYQRLPNGMEIEHVEGYRLTQTVEVRSPDVGQIETLSREATQLIRQARAIRVVPAASTW